MTDEQTDQPPHTPISEPGKGNITVTPRPKGGIRIHQGKFSIALSPAECSRLKFAINEESIARQNGTGFYEDRRVKTESTDAYKARRRDSTVVYSSATPAKETAQ